LFLLIGLLPACVHAQPLAPFSAARPGGELPGGWREWIVDPRKPATRYSLIEDAGKVVVCARANASVSALVFDVKGPAARLQWRWKVERTIPGADERERARDDSPARLLVAFSGDLSRLSAEERAQHSLASALSGRELPYATLVYSWSNARPRETVSINPRSSRARTIVVEQGTRRVGRWTEYRRDLRADYRKAFGEEPGEIAWIGVMTDADDTASSARAYYGDITLVQ
jgi:hypothetical protein